MADNTIEIVIKADGTQAIANINKIRQAITEVDQKATTGKVREEFAQLQKVGKLVERELTSSFKTIGITGSLLSGGLVAGLVMAGKALADFGRQGLELHHLSRELGVGAESLMRWKLAGQAAGLTAEQASADVNSAMRKLQELGRRGGYSELYTQLAESTADLTGRNLAQALYQEVQKGGPEQGFRFLLQKLQDYAKSGNRWGVTTVSNILSLSPGWEHSIDLIDKIGKVYVVSEEKAQRYQLSVTLLGQQLSNLQTEIGSELLPVFAEMADQLRSWLQTPDGQKFQADLVKMARELENLPWKDIREGAESTIKFIKIVFEEGTKVIQAFIWTFQQGIDAYNKFRDWNRRKLRDEIEAGLHGRERRDLQSLPGGGRGAPGPYGGNTAGIPGLPGSPSGPAGGRRADQIPNDLSPQEAERLRNRMRPRRGGSAQNFYGVMGGGDTEFSSVNRRQQSTEDLNDQMRDVTDEVRRLNDLLRGGGDVARTPGGGAGGMGPTGSTSISSSTSSTSSNNPQNPPREPFDPRKGYDPRQPGNAPAGQTPSLIGPGGAPMPAWGATTADFGGGTGGGAAGGVPGLAGGPSGRALTPEERKAAAGPDPNAVLKGEGPKGRVDQAALSARLVTLIKEHGLEGIVPSDAAAWGFKTGSAEEWSAFMTKLAYAESGFKSSTVGDVGKFGHGSRGLFQLSGQDAINYGIRDTPFTKEELADPDFNSRMAVIIMRKRLEAGKGLMTKEGAQKYWARGSTFRKIGPQDVEKVREAVTNRPNTPNNPQNPPQNASNPQNPQQSPQPATGTGPPGDIVQGTVKEMQQKVAETRKGALDPRLRTALSYAAGMTGLEVRVASGGQRMPGATGAVGSHRHDQGKAADFDLYDEKGNLVHPSDPRALDFYRHAAHAGVTGGGAGPGYMGGTRSHLDIESEKYRSPVYHGSKEFRAAIEAGKAARRKGVELAKRPTTDAPAVVNNTSQQNPHSSIPAILQPRQGAPLASTGGGVGGDAARDAKIAKMRDDAAGVQKQSRDNDAAADREKVDRGLRDQINKATVSGKANIDITVKSDGKSSGDDSKLFNTTRSKSAPQMPNTPSDGDGDRSSTSDED